MPTNLDYAERVFPKLTAAWQALNAERVAMADLMDVVGFSSLLNSYMVRYWREKVELLPQDRQVAFEEAYVKLFGRLPLIEEADAVTR